MGTDGRGNGGNGEEEARCEGKGWKAAAQKDQMEDLVLKSEKKGPKRLSETRDDGRCRPDHWDDGLQRLGTRGTVHKVCSTAQRRSGYFSVSVLGNPL